MGAAALAGRLVVWALSALAVLGVGLGGAGAAAASSWSPESVPAPPGLPNGQLFSVSCMSGGGCEAVGSFTRANVGVVLAERWNGSRWSIQNIPTPRGASSGALSGVSCASRRVCVAVGSYTDGTGRRVTLAERWNGSRWSLQRTPNRAGSAGSGLSGVSCPSPSVCAAVGSGPGGVLVERLSRSAWSIQRTPRTKATKGGGLSGVSCVSRRACTAVGSTPRGALVERWNGSRWSVQPTPRLGGAVLSGVSCPSGRVCIAVGSHRGATLAERWNGSAWAVRQTPTPSDVTFGNSDASLSAVSCPSATACFAVGSDLPASDNGTIPRVIPLAERWNGSRWSIQATPGPSQQGCSNFCLTQLNGVSCRSGRTCTAVGSYTVITSGAAATFGEGWNGSRWSIRTTPSPDGGASSQLNGVSCTSAAACTAVGASTSSAGTQVSLAERWNGASWSVQLTPNPPARAPAS